MSLIPRIERNQLLSQISRLLEQFPSVCLLGPRQVGKTTLAKEYAHQQTSHYTNIHRFDLEDPADFEALQNPQLVLSRLEGLIIIDEIQRMPTLFPLLRVLIDSPKKPQKWLLLGSASRDLFHHSSDTLAGRIAYLEINPLSFREVHTMDPLWLRGGFPGSYLATQDENSMEWRKQYIKTYLEMDIPNLGLRVPANQLRRFWMMLSHYHGNLLNLSDFSTALGMSSATIKRYLDILTDTFMIRQLQPWWENIGKRQVKSPKIYLRDTGLLHYFWGVESDIQLLHHPKIGASWEGFVIEELLKAYPMQAESAYFWATHAQAELDLMLTIDGARWGFECKFADAPKLTRSMKIACEDLQLKGLKVIYPGEKSYWLDEHIQVCPLKDVLDSPF